MPQSNSTQNQLIRKLKKDYTLSYLKEVAVGLGITGCTKKRKHEVIEILIQKKGDKFIADHIGIDLESDKSNQTNQKGDNLKKQKKFNWTTIVNFGVVVAIFAGLFTIVRHFDYFRTTYFPDYLPPKEISCSINFDKNSDYKILAFPFNNYSSTSKRDVPCEKAIKNGIGKISPTIDIKIDYKNNIDTIDFDYQYAQKIGLACSANMVLWGSYDYSKLD